MSHCCLCVGNVKQGYIYSNARTPLSSYAFIFVEAARIVIVTEQRGEVTDIRSLYRDMVLKLNRFDS